jgi:hypothetical protein
MIAMTTSRQTIAQASATVEQAMRDYLDAGNHTATPGGMLYILADLCRERAEAEHAAGASYGVVAQWTLWADRMVRGMP